LSQGRHGRVVDDKHGAGFFCQTRCLREVAQVEPGIGWRLGEDEAVAREPAVQESACRAQVTGDAQATEKALGEDARRVIAVGGQEDAVSRLHDGEECGRDGRHAGRKGEGGRAFQVAEQLLRRFPGRIVEASILGKASWVARQVEHAGRRDGQADRLALGEAQSAQMQQFCRSA
jgi:hypothetical protein